MKIRNEKKVIVMKYKVGVFHFKATVVNSHRWKISHLIRCKVAVIKNKATLCIVKLQSCNIIT